MPKLPDPEVSDYRIKKEVRRIPNTSFQPHQYLEADRRHHHRKWKTGNGTRLYRSFRPYMLQYWPYRYWLIVMTDCAITDLTGSCMFNIRPVRGGYMPVPDQHRVIGYRRQRDRNRDAKRLWPEVVGWAGGHFVY